MALGVVLLSKVIDLMFDNIPFQTNCLFIGLIIGSFPFILKNVKGHKMKVQHVLACLLFFGLVVGSALLGESSGEEAALVGGIVPMIKMFGVGVIASATMIIPGVSGGTMMVAMGIYDKLIHCITHLKSEFKEAIKLLIPIFAGAGIAVILLSRLFEYLLAVYPIPTNFAFCGLIAGSLPFLPRNHRYR